MKWTAAILARAGLALAIMGGATQCEKPITLQDRMVSLADVPGGGRVYFDSILVPPSTTALVGAIYERSTIWGDLTLPPDASPVGVPAVILVPSCAGVGGSLRRWADVIVGAGYAAFVLDSFGGREIKETCTGRQAINTASMLGDIYRAQALLATHRHIDSGRIAVMGFSFGGRAALWAALTRFQQPLKPATTAPLAAYLAFYPASCWFHFRDETEVAGGPIRLFHGTADNATPLLPCRDWAQRLRAAGRDVGIYEYAGAHHAFDVPSFSPPRVAPDHVNLGKCEFDEFPDGSFRDKTTGARPGPTAACATRGYTQAYDAAAHQKAIEDVRTFLAAAFRRGGR
jgi:dienelactone hydrolase